MNLHNSTGWLFSIVATVTLFAGGSYLMVEADPASPEMIQFSDLSDADIDMIIAVKAEMQAAKTQIN